MSSQEKTDYSPWFEWVLSNYLKALREKLRSFEREVILPPDCLQTVTGTLAPPHYLPAQLSCYKPFGASVEIKSISTGLVHPSHD